MKRFLTAAALAAGLAAPAFAQDAATVVCKDYAAMDNAGRNAAAAQRARRLGMGDDHGRRRQPVIGEGDFVARIELEATPVLVVPYRHARSLRSAACSLI